MSVMAKCMLFELFLVTIKSMIYIKIICFAKESPLFAE